MPFGDTTGPGEDLSQYLDMPRVTWARVQCDMATCHGHATCQGDDNYNADAAEAVSA